MKLDELIPIYDKMQKKYGARELDSIYNGGCIDKPLLFFVFKMCIRDRCRVL